MNSRITKIVLAYSGGLDTSVMLKWLKERYKCCVIAFIADLGQDEDLERIKEKALMIGADSVIVEDLKEEFVSDYVFPILRANAVYEGSYLLGTSIARPLIARKQIEIAKSESADAVSHGATGKGNDQVRFELAYYAMQPDIHIIAPWREWDMKGRGDLIQYAKKHQIPITITEDTPYSIDRNIMHSSYEGGELEDPWHEPDISMFMMTQAPEDAPDTPAYIEIDYKNGNPISLNGTALSPAEMLHTLNLIGGEHGIGRVDLVENRYVGMKSRGVYETPGATILHSAHRAVESLTLDREVMHLRDSLSPKYSELIYYGFWFSPERRMLQEAIDVSQKHVSGKARIKLYKGNCIVTGRKSDESLYNEQLASFEKDGGYNQHDAEGFIKLNALRLKALAHRKDISI